MNPLNTPNLSNVPNALNASSALDTLKFRAMELKRRWARFSAMERHQMVGAFCFLIALFYGLLVWTPGNKHLGELGYKEEKQTLRNRPAGKVEDELKKFNLAALNPQMIQRDLKKVRQLLTRQQTEQTRLLARFAPPDDLESLQRLKSEITRLAESTDMEITALEHIYRRAEDRNRPPTRELLMESMSANPYQRPLLRLTARASYRGLMQFLKGLSWLPYIAAPVWSDISVKSEGDANGSRQWLEVEIRLAI